MKAYKNVHDGVFFEEKIKSFLIDFLRKSFFYTMLIDQRLKIHWTNLPSDKFLYSLSISMRLVTRVKVENQENLK